jgi:hypothetical protein
MSEVKVDSIGPRVDSGTLTIGAAGDTINIAGTAGTGFPTPTTGIAASAITTGTMATARLGSGTASSSTFLRGDQTYAAAGGDMTPAFSVVKTDNQSISNNTDTIVTFQTEILDTNGAFASNRFTVPVGTADAKYFIFAQAACNSGNNSDLKLAYLNLFVNGSRQAMSAFDARSNQPRLIGMTVGKVLGLGAGDYVEVKAKVDTDDAGITIDGSDSQTTFCGFKIIT